MQTHSSLRALTLALAASAYSYDVRAEPATLNFDDLAEVATAGFTNVEGGGTTTVSDGIATIVGETFEEWRIDSAADKWFVSTLNDGWVVEARIRIVNADPNCGSTGFWISGLDASLVHFQMSSAWAGINYPRQHRVEMDTTDGFHTYRLQYVGYFRYLIIIDDELVADVHQVAGGGGTPELMFGDLGGCGGATSEWDWFRYDPVSNPIPEGDADADGVDNTVDNCATDENADQADVDRDRNGDLCDRCPNDAMNDADGDGLCGDVDPCPEDGRNDQDEDGTCDTEQCAPYDSAIAACTYPDCEIPANCPEVCNCQRPFFGIDPPPLDQFLPPTPTGSVVTPAQPAPTPTPPVQVEPAASTGVDAPLETAELTSAAGTGPSEDSMPPSEAVSADGASTEVQTGSETPNSSDSPTAMASNSGEGCSLTAEHRTHSPTALMSLVLATSLLVSRRRRGKM